MGPIEKQHMDWPVRNPARGGHAVAKGHRLRLPSPQRTSMVMGDDFS